MEKIRRGRGKLITIKGTTYVGISYSDTFYPQLCGHFLVKTSIKYTLTRYTLKYGRFLAKTGKLLQNVPTF